MAAIGELFEIPLVLRVVRCLPSRAELPRRDRAHRAGVVQASREETAECTSVAEEAYMAMEI
jgi:hypothetical protein